MTDIEHKLDIIEQIMALRDEMDAYVADLQDHSEHPETEAFLDNVRIFLEGYAEDFLDDIDGETLEYLENVAPFACDHHKAEYEAAATQIRNRMENI